jgi:HEAT repeat protein
VTHEDSRSIAELFAAATDWSCEDGLGDWSAVATLHHLGSREVLDWALQLTKADDPRLRARGVDILGQLGIPERTFPDECLQAAVALLTGDREPRVLESAAVALGHLHDPRGTDALVRHVDHADPDVRHAVAFGLGGNAELAGVAALIRLMDDSEAMVRDWATFGLGVQGKVDTSAVREALFRRLGDPDEDTRYEAFCGLARVRDLRVVRPLIDALKASPKGHRLWEPATMLLKTDDTGDPSADQLIAALTSLLQD